MAECIRHWNDSGKCFTWTKGCDEVKRKAANGAKV